MSTEVRELTHSQTQIWIGQRLHPESPLYNMAFAFVFPAELRTDVFCEAWRRVADQSDALKTRVRVVHRGAAMREIAETGAPTEILDFSDRLDPVQDFRVWCQERCARPLPLDGDLVASVLVRLGEGRTGWYLNQHHLIADAWSTELLYRQVAIEYDALLRGGGEKRVSLAPYYPTVAALRSSAKERAEAMEHWDARRERPGRLVPFYGRNALPTGTQSSRSTLELGEVRSRAIDELCKQNGFASLSEQLSRFSLLATALVSWLHRISGSTELGFDAPMAGRPTPEAKRALGLFIEMFPFAASVAPHDSFRSLGARCLEESIKFLRHAQAGTSSPSSAAASNVVLNYFPGSFGDFAGVPVEAQWLHPGHGDSIHSLRVQAHDFSRTGRYTLHFDFNLGALPDRLRRRSLEHFENVLDALLDDPDRELASVDILTNDERHALVSLSATSATPLPDRTVVTMLQDQARREPDRVALRQNQSELSFAAMIEQSEALAATLVENGIETGDRVAIICRRSTQAVIAILATLRARAAYVTIDRSAPKARLEYVLRDSGARAVLVGDGAERSVAPMGAGVPVISIAEGIRTGDGAGLARPGPELDDLAYLMYTSGSTGRPKGVLVEHAGLADYLCWAARKYVRGERLSFPLFTSLTFDLTVTSLFLPLITGGTLEIYPDSDGPVDTALMDVVAANAVDFIKLTPSHLALLRRLGFGRSRIRRMVVGGENFSTSLAAAVSHAFQDEVEIYNEYGPTEAVVGCMIHRYDPVVDTDASVPIGRPADHVELEVLNESGSPVPEGVPGELWISRYGLARGYHGLAELTEERFPSVPNRQGRRRYRTGDRVRMVDGSKLEYLGRLDRQLKVSGFRVEPGEIESAMLSLPMIEQCAVAAHHRRAPALETSSEIHSCVRCGLPSNYPRMLFDEQGVCNLCKSYESIKEHVRSYFKTMDDLRALFQQSGRNHRSKYDCMMLYSGGKDSTYALCQLVEMGLSVYAFSLDNGFLSDSAKENITKVTRQLAVPVEFGTTPAMNAIFRDSLTRFANVCNGCFKTIYSLSMKRAHELAIPIIVTGLSRGQMFETRLSEEMFRGDRHPEEIDAAVLAARKAYHRVPDEVTRSLDVTIFKDDRIFEEIRFVDFYRYCDVDLDEMLSYLQREVAWVRPEDTGRSTNCLINDAGIYVHKRERGYHNYALPYSWDVRLGHKTREGALNELDDEIDVSRVKNLLAEIGYDEERFEASLEKTTLEAFYVASEDVNEVELRSLLREHLPPHLVPARLQRVDSIPLTSNGKVDEEALTQPAFGERTEKTFRAPEGPVAEYLAGVWQQEIGAARVGADDNFFELGGTSLTAMQIMLRLCQEFDIDLPLDTLFSHPVLGELARVAEDTILQDVAELSGSDADEQGSPPNHTHP